MKRLIVLIFVFLIGCGLEIKTLSQFYDGDINKVSKVVILNGNTGYKKTIEDRTVIENFLNTIKDIKFIPEDNQESRDGFNYAITLYQNREEIFTFSLTKVNDHYYHTEPDIFPIVDNFYRSLEINEE